MSGFLDIKRKGTNIPSQNTVSRQAQQEIERHLALLRRDYLLANEGKFPVPPQRVAIVKKTGVPTTDIGGQTIVRSWFAGLPHEGLDDASVIEFVPKNAHARVGEKVSWLLVGGANQGHTISFDVPQYLPIFTIKPDGTVVRNPQLDKPAGGAPPLPPEAQSSGPGTGNGPPPKPAVIDGGTWDGQKFFSSGLISPGTFALYSLRLSRPGTYKFACLVHPLMVGTLVVTP
jgi:plastocyanin